MFKPEFTADLLLSVLETEPQLPLFLGFMAGEPSLDNNMPRFCEVQDPAYRRQPVLFRPPVDGFITLVHDVSYPRATRRWPRISYLTVFDAETGGSPLFIKSTGGSLNVDVGERVAIAVGEMSLYVGTNLYHPHPA